MKEIFAGAIVEVNLLIGASVSVILGGCTVVELSALIGGILCVSRFLSLHLALKCSLKFHSSSLVSSDMFLPLSMLLFMSLFALSSQQWRK